MMKLSRKIVVFVALTGFLLSSANVFLYIHLAEHQHKGDCHQDSKCPICQQAAISKTNALVTYDAVSFELPLVIYTNLYKSKVIAYNSDFRIPYLRAPPSLA
jgi:hypothetical protein